MGRRRWTCKDDDGKWDSCAQYPTLGSWVCDHVVSSDPKDVGYCKGTSPLFLCLAEANDRMNVDGQMNRNAISMERLMLLDHSGVGQSGC